MSLDSRVAYSLIVSVVALQRLVELRVSRRNLRQAAARGAVEAGAGHYPWMVALHTAFPVACLVETWALQRPWRPTLGITMLAALAGAAALRWWVIASLGGRWTTRVVYVPGDPLVTHGPFRWMKHPNYLAVAVEIAALPLVHGGWITAIVFSAGNAALLRARIAAESALLGRLAGRGTGGRP